LPSPIDAHTGRELKSTARQLVTPVVKQPIAKLAERDRRGTSGLMGDQSLRCDDCSCPPTSGELLLFQHQTDRRCHMRM
jgi:hypothetical protein